MESSQELKHRRKPEQPQVEPTTMDNKKKAMAKRGLRSLAIAIAIPVTLTLANIVVFARTSHSYHPVPKPFWFPPLWAMHLMCLTMCFVMGLSAWLVWAEGGFHRNPRTAGLYLTQLAFSLLRDPILFRMGASRVGLMVCLGLFGSLAACSRVFKEVNPIAGDLVKPCIAWAGFLTLVNLKLVYL